MSNSPNMRQNDLSWDINGGRRKWA